MPFVIACHLHRQDSPPTEALNAAISLPADVDAWLVDHNDCDLWVEPCEPSEPETPNAR